MGKRLSRLLTLSLLLFVHVSADAGMNIKANLLRLGELSKQKPVKAADDGLLQAVSLIDRSMEDARIPQEVKRLVDSRKFQTSKYVPALVYYMLVNSAEPAALEGWFTAIRAYDGSPYFFPAQLVRLDDLKARDMAAYKREASATVAWLKSQTEEHSFFGPEIKGTSVWGFKARADFREGTLPALVKKNAYLASSLPLPGFGETNTYLVLLEANKDSDDTLDEMARIYLRTGKPKTAASNFFELGNRRFNNGQFMDAKNFYQRASSLDPDNKSYATALDKANLELLYTTEPDAEQAAAADAPVKHQKMGAVTGKNVNLRAAPSILGEALDKVSGPLDVPIFETYVAEDAAEGVLKQDAALATDGAPVELKSGKAVFIVSDLGEEMVINVTLGDKKYTGRLPSDAVSRTAGGKWYKVEANNRVGWIFGDFLKEK